MKPSLDETVPLRTAFVIMQRYLEFYWEHTGRGGEIGSLLSDVQMLQDGGTADPAALEDWLTVAETVIRGGQGPLFMQLTPKP
ncbi:hypothetical protein [Pedosphaera parvula]|uniref:Uncharacterized protein n=1 Tax=Pedosphaera parvula (strain Ellin514) TaxID=320771 RepID=B9XHQ9_PEDPL|nr:hypothetical protein [Pedosphaera parvula]EEF60637.1 conserved hypothetical protein [Pedosphaera parvula Ellin514]